MMSLTKLKQSKGGALKGSSKPSARLRARAKAKHRRPKLKLYALRWQQLNEKQKARYMISLSVLGRVREGVSFSAACQEHHVSRATARRYLGKTLYRARATGSEPTAGIACYVTCRAMNRVG